MERRGITQEWVAAVVDSNVAWVASRLTPQADERCIGACIKRFAKIKDAGAPLVNDLGLILYEYTGNLGHSGRPGAGHVFARWAHDIQGIHTMVRQVRIAAVAKARLRSFQEFPDCAERSTFDKSDWTFVSVALVSGVNQPPLNAVDSDWWIHRASLTAVGSNIEFLFSHHAPAR